MSVEFETEDLPRAETFYGSVLGLPTTRENGTLTIRAGTSTIILKEGARDQGRQHLAFTIPRLMFDSAKQWTARRVSLLLDADGQDEFETSPHWNAHSLYFADPDGNILEFIIRRAILDDQAGPFNPSTFNASAKSASPPTTFRRWRQLPGQFSASTCTVAGRQHFNPSEILKVCSYWSIVAGLGSPRPRRAGPENSCCTSRAD
ncbi:VOC family protein [Arthrobacter sp. TMN-50]